jgi:hypothetical protein
VKFVIDGVEYPVATLDRITGRHALDLVKYAGVGVATMERLLPEIARLRFADDGSVIVAPEGEDSDDAAEALFSSEPHLRALLALVWMSRRFGGEPNLPFDVVLDLPIKEIQSDTSDEDEAEEAETEADPTSPPASDPQEPGEPDAA